MFSEVLIKLMKQIGPNYPNRGFGGHFYEWIFSDDKPYNSFGNSAAMRISAFAGFELVYLMQKRKQEK